MMKRTIRIKINLPYSQEQVWQALTTPSSLGEWFMKNDFQPQIGHEFTFRMAPQKGWDGITYCKVLTINPLQNISFTYKGQATGEKTLACAGIHSEIADKAAKTFFTQLDTVVTFTLTPTCGGTLLELHHSGFSGLKLYLVSFVMAMGWKKQLRKKLPKLLEKSAH
jgi:uncharacterized protein YndB with AHSA1/START domain